MVGLGIIHTRHPARGRRPVTADASARATPQNGDAVAGGAVLSPVHLPLSLGRFIGRRAEIEELRRRMAESRLMTLTGPGGCGKTRLALELAAEVRCDYADGVAFVQLSAVRDPAAMRESVAGALGLPREASDRLADLVGSARLLLGIDNVEHPLDTASPPVQELLTRRPHPAGPATSRGLLGR